MSGKMSESLDVNCSSSAAQSVWEAFDWDVMSQSLSLVEQCYRASIYTVGMLANGVVVLVASFSHRLRQPRHTFAAAVALFEFMFLLNGAVELVAVRNRNALACQLWVLFHPFDDAALTLCQCLAATGRYLSIARRQWYGDNVTNKSVLLLVALTSAFSFLIVAGPFWTGYKSISNCTLNLTHLMSVQTWNFALGGVCVLLHLKSFSSTGACAECNVSARRCRRPESANVTDAPQSTHSHASGTITDGKLASPTAHSGQLSDAPSPSPSMTGNSAADAAMPTRLQPPGVSAEQESASVESDFDRKPNRADKRSKRNRRPALTTAINVLQFALGTLPTFCYFSLVYCCVWLNMDCGPVFLSWPYVWDVRIAHSVIAPVAYLATTKTFAVGSCHNEGKTQKRERKTHGERGLGHSRASPR